MKTTRRQFLSAYANARTRLVFLPLCALSGSIGAQTTAIQQPLIQRSVQQPVVQQTVIQQPVIQQSIQQPVQQVIQQPVQQVVQQPVQQTVQQPIQQAVQQPIQQPVQQPVQQSAPQPVQQSAQQPTQQTAQQRTQQPAQQGMQQAAQEGAQQPAGAQQGGQQAQSARGEQAQPARREEGSAQGQPAKASGKDGAQGLKQGAAAAGGANEKNDGPRKPSPAEGGEAPRAQREQRGPRGVGAERLAQLAVLDTVRREQRADLFKEAAAQLQSNPQIADVEECSGRSDVCVPGPAAIARVQSAIVQPVEIGRRVAYLIGNNRYAEPIPQLETPKADVEAIGKVLRERLGYDVKVLLDAGKADIIRTLQLAGKTTGRHQSVLVMYAGHGYQIKETQQGYWIPSDANTKDPSGWVSNGDITKLLTAIPAKQVVLISDSCYSGTLAKEQSANVDLNAARADLLARRSVLALTSGGEEPVSDEGRDGHSVFAASLIERLAELEGNSTVGRLFEQVRADVTASYPQVPQLGAITSAGHSTGGDYLLDPRK